MDEENGDDIESVSGLETGYSSGNNVEVLEKEVNLKELLFRIQKRIDEVAKASKR